MTGHIRHLLYFGLSIISCCILFTACNAIDDDLRDCEKDFRIRYNVKLKTNLQTQIQTVLRNRFEMDVADLLEDSLKFIFREYAHDVDLSFYINNNRRYHDRHIMEAGQAVYELELPAENYRHLALANIDEEREVNIQRSEWADNSMLHQEEGDIIRGHNTGLFTARKDMDITGKDNQTFDVMLYMANCASILVVRTENINYRDMQVYSGDFADGFLVNDSVFTFTSSPLIHDFRVTSPPVEREVYYAVTFPSHDTAEEAQGLSRAYATDGGQTGASDRERIWRKYVHVTMPDGTVTRTTINVREPLQAGQVIIIYAYLMPNGGIYSPNVEVSTSIQLDWKQGLEIGS